MIKSLLIVLAILFFQFSCTFPNKMLLKKYNNISGDLPKICSLARNEFIRNTESYTTAKVSDAELRNILTSYDVEYIKVTYTLADTRQSNVRTTFDSTVTLTWSKNYNDEIISENLIYFFGTDRHKMHLRKDGSTKQIQLNDSISLQQRKDVVVTVY